jgi:hypothetical protein
MGTTLGRTLGTTVGGTQHTARSLMDQSWATNPAPGAFDWFGLGPGVGRGGRLATGPAVHRRTHDPGAVCAAPGESRRGDSYPGQEAAKVRLHFANRLLGQSD